MEVNELAKKNCWEILNCGREPGGTKIDELGVCPAATDTSVDGLNSGKNAGRVCWSLTGTLCAGEVQGDFDKKMAKCAKCEVFTQVFREEELFVMYPNGDGEYIPAHLMFSEEDEIEVTAEEAEAQSAQ
jgi:hypothetical protein